MNEEASGNGALVAAFIKAQSEMSAVIKGAVNPAFKSRYADLASVIDAVLPALNKNGIGLVQSPRFDGETVTVETVLMHSGGGTIKNELAMRPTKSDPQGVGSAITYARRYALLAICGVAPEDDDGNAASVPQARPAPQRAETIYADDQSKPRVDDRGVKRLSSAEAKRIGLHTEIEGKLDRCESLLALDLFESAFDTITAQCPLSWLDALRNRIILRREELTSTTGKEDADMDAAFRATMAG